MNNFGFMKIACASPELRVANTKFNCAQIKSAIEMAAQNGANLLLTPELSLCGYTCADLFFQDTLLNGCLAALQEVCDFTSAYNMPVVVGAPLKNGNALYNAAVVLYQGRILGVVPKSYLANYGEFNEKRWFVPGEGATETDIILFGQSVPFGKLLFRLNEHCTMGIELCEDLWVTVPPSSYMALSSANLILNPSASNDLVAKNQYRKDLVVNQSARCMCAYAFVSSGVGESTTDMVFGGASLIAENGTLLAEGERFSQNGSITYADVDLYKLRAQRYANPTFTDNRRACAQNYHVIACDSVPMMELKHFTRLYESTPFVPSDAVLCAQRCEEIFNMQAAALVKRLRHTGLNKCVVGISGGLDSTLALLVCVKAIALLELPLSNILGITMPGFGTTDRTYTNALRLMRVLGVTIREVDIKAACTGHLQDIGHDLKIHDVTYENAQARERTQILMDIANASGALLVGTGDLSEAAMGWCTYNGDHMSMYGVNAGVPKTLMRYMVDYVAGQSAGEIAAVLRDVLDTPVSPELLPPDENGNISQKTEDNIGPYELHDFFLYHFFRYGAAPKKIAFLAEKAFSGRYDAVQIQKWLAVFLKRFSVSQFKRSCTPDGPKVGSVSLSPRGDWRMPSDADFAVWMENI
ncbi:MAG: NAD(+) synthase [Clostridia bacterium]|nr:NAD(+) synthase [Clostridia bacterium]